MHHPKKFFRKAVTEIVQQMEQILNFKSHIFNIRNDILTIQTNNIKQIVFNFPSIYRILSKPVSYSLYNILFTL